MAEKRKKVELAENVTQFIDECARIAGHQAEVSLSQDLFCESIEIGMESPIEQLLYCAVKTLAKLNDVEEGKDPIQIGDEWHVLGLFIRPQVKIDNYRVDFVIGYVRHWKNQYETTELVVECDSQQFHERTEAERRYEKKRDRYMVSRGYKVFRFTGAEICREPFRVAADILAELIKSNVEELLIPVEDAMAARKLISPAGRAQGA